MQEKNLTPYPPLHFAERGETFRHIHVNLVPNKILMGYGVMDHPLYEVERAGVRFLR
jgi:hypothetical protein